MGSGVGWFRPGKALPSSADLLSYIKKAGAPKDARLIS